jgi:hypothetical protein
VHFIVAFARNEFFSKMRKTMKILLIVCVLLSFVPASAHLAAQETAQDTAQDTAEQMAQQSDETWLALLDSAQYVESWKAATTAFQAAVTEEKWESTMKNVRVPMGKMQTRRIQSAAYTTHLPGVPDGEYVVVIYETSFEHKQAALETVIASLEKDKVWRVAGYYIK